MTDTDLEVAYDELLADYDDLIDLLKALYDAHNESGEVVLGFWEMQQLLDGTHHVLQMGGRHQDVRQEDDDEEFDD